MNKNSITFEDLQTRITNFIEQAKSVSETTDFKFVIATNIDTDYTFTSVKGMSIYRIIQEGVNNAIKYANAKNIIVSIDTVNEEFQITVKDDGNGFDVSEITLGNGLNNMKKRARDIEGKIEIISVLSEGTTLQLNVQV